MAQRAHYRRTITTDGDVNVVTGIVVRIYDPGTTTSITDIIYAASSGSTELSQPITYSDGTIEFYLAAPRRVRIGVTPPGSGEFFLEDVDVPVPAGNAIVADGPIHVTNTPSAAGEVLTSLSATTAQWATPAGGGGGGGGGAGAPSDTNSVVFTVGGTPLDSFGTTPGGAYKGYGLDFSVAGSLLSQTGDLFVPPATPGDYLYVVRDAVVYGRFDLRFDPATLTAGSIIVTPIGSSPNPNTENSTIFEVTQAMIDWVNDGDSSWGDAFNLLPVALTGAPFLVLGSNGGYWPLGFGMYVPVASSLVPALAGGYNFLTYVGLTGDTSAV